MRFSRLLICCICCLTATLSLPLRAADHAGIDVSLPADAHLIGRLDLNRILESPLGPVLLKEVGDNYAAINWFLGSVFGFDLTSVGSIWFALDANDRRVILLPGRYQMDLVQERLGSMPGWTRLDYNAVPLASTFRDQDGNELIAAVLDSGLLALGDRSVMDAMLSNRAARLAEAGPARPGVQRVGASSAELAVAMLNDNSVARAGLDFDVVESAWLEGRFAEDLELQAEVEAGDARLAEGLQQILSGSLVIAEVHPEVRADAAYLQAVRDGRVEREGTTVSLTTVVRRTLLEKR